MAKKISVTLGASQDISHTTFTLGDLGFTDDEWEALNESDKEAAIVDAVNELLDQPYWVMDGFEEKD